MSIPWKFEDAMPVIGSITEGPAWDGHHLFFTNIALDRVLRYEPKSERVTVWRTGTKGANGLNFDAGGRMFACEGRGRRIARYDPDGGTVTVVDALRGRRING